ncbi:MAG: prepilin-type N-terminal cleavage/methylation domain-containing protein [Fimbriimonas sp.]|nr:prepilin-type N-terminal cleavage/methylation domain-containing protein [Fimbriimonas sp.]
MRTTKQAFTLIELLVVIAIIAILAAILFPVFAQAKKSAKSTVSLSNVKQMNLGAVMYSNDSDDMYPPNYVAQGIPLSVSVPPDEGFLLSRGDKCWTWAGNGSGSNDPGGNSASDPSVTSCYWTWGEVSYPYFKNAQMETDPGSINGNGDPGLANFGMNLEFTASQGHFGLPYPTGVTSTQLNNPAGQILIIESGNWVAALNTFAGVSGYNYIPAVCPNGLGAGKASVGGFVNCVGNTSWGVADQNQVMSDITHGRRNSLGVNVGYADGHAKLTQTAAIAADAPNYWCLTPNPAWSKSSPQASAYNCGPTYD